MLKFRGLVAATFTPMREDGSLALDKVPMLVEHLIKNEMAGLFAVGSTGEFPSLTHDERKVVGEAFIAAAAGRIPVIVNVGSCSVRESQLLAEHAVAAGADAICAMVPFYFRPPTVRELAECLKEIAKACGGRPLYLYHIPCMTHANLPMYDLLKIMESECPNFAGIKYTDENLYEFQRCTGFGDRFQMMYGRDEMLLASFVSGGEAGVGSTYNYFPRVYRGLVDAYRKGDFEEARRFQELSQRGIVMLGKYGMASQKMYMKFAGLDIGPMRLPAPRFSKERELEFRRAVSEAGLDPWLG
ncbi:MAG: N-acetylneuraminate lyase [Lentisphaeria bacterium]|nr:N-acetylneuraminate lyase [Lentisphaeria bacterium]